MFSRTLSSRSTGALVDALTGARATNGAHGVNRSLSSRLPREVLLLGVGVLLLALAAHLRVTLPFTVVPITGQTFAVLLLGAAYGWRRGGATVALYLAAGLVGLPVFAEVAGMATWGYLLGFLLAALVVGWLAERGWDRAFGSAIAAMLVGEIAIYACGLPWLAHFFGWNHVLALGLLPFLPGDALKLVAAAVLLPVAWQVTRAALGRRKHA